MLSGRKRGGCQWRLMAARGLITLARKLFFFSFILLFVIEFNKCIFFCIVFREKRHGTQ